MNLPSSYRTYLEERLPQPVVERLCGGLQAEPSVSLRVNPMRLAAEAVPEDADGRVPWCPEGFYLRQRPLFTADPLFHAGAYYVQEASSMFLAHALRSRFPLPEKGFALDLCAAPGGKSTLLRSLLPDEWWLVCNEPVRKRAQVLAENMAKWGHPNVLVTQALPEDIGRVAPATMLFDLMLADVPCSGEGMFRKEEDAVRQWSPAFVAECAALQRRILTDAWPALRPGGLLFYSTCTFNPEEDEQNVEWIRDTLGADIIALPVPSEWHIDGDLRDGGRLPVFHFLPGTVRGEGFFLAVLRKHGEAEDVPVPRKEKKKGKKGAVVLSPQENFRQQLETLPTDLLDNASAPRVEVSLTDALRYLQRETITLPADAPRGLVTVCFRGQRLGLVNNIGTRANNLYPQAWRVRSSYIEAHTLFPDIA